MGIVPHIFHFRVDFHMRVNNPGSSPLTGDARQRQPKLALALALRSPKARWLWQHVPASVRLRVHGLLKQVIAGALSAVLSCVEPFIKVRFALMVYSRIGHLAMNTDVFLRRLELTGRPARTKFVFVASDANDVANPALVTLWKNHLAVIDRGLCAAILRFIWPAFQRSRFVIDLSVQSREYREFALVDSVVRFTPAEERRGCERLRTMGIKEGDWFICFHNRDSAYLRQTIPGRNFSYHDYRDSSINNYLPAARLVAERGGFAIRLGAVVQEKLDLEDQSQIVDYATRDRDDFMDLYLSARCRFFLGTSDGLTQVPLLFDRPIAYANCVPIYTLLYGKSSLFIPKLFKRRSENGLMSYPELQLLGAYRKQDAVQYAEWYRERDIEVIENSPEDIRDLCLDMFDKLDGNALPSGASELQREYKDRFFGDDPDRTYAPNIGARFALKYRDLIFG